MIRKSTFITSLVCGTFLVLTASPGYAMEPSQQGQRLGTDVRIEVDTQQQQVRVYANQSLIKEMPCSTGKSETPTPTGSFKTNEKVTGRAIEVDGKEVSYYPRKRS